jgi:thiamine biosynthesis lipoprotein
MTFSSIRLDCTSLVGGWEFPIVDRAVSISGGYGFRFDEEERFNHVLNPANDGCGDFYPSVTVVSRTTTAADAHSMTCSPCGFDCCRTSMLNASTS